MKRQFIFFLIMVVSFFGDCQPEEQTQPAETITSTRHASNTPPAAQKPTPTPLPQELPSFLYIYDENLIEQKGRNVPVVVTSLPEDGDVLAAVLTDEEVAVLRETGIQRLNLGDGSVDPLLPFDRNLFFGDLMPVKGGSQILFSGAVSDNDTPFGVSSLVGYYDHRQQTAEIILELPRNVHLLGLTEDGQGLYLLPLGQDPDFGAVYLYDLNNLDKREKFSIRGTGYASLSSGSRYLAFTTYQVISDTGTPSLKPVIHLYDLSSLPPAAPERFPIPDSKGGEGFGGLLWSPNTDMLYFLFAPQKYEEEEVNPTHVLWGLDIDTGEKSQILEITDRSVHLVSIHPGGKWALLRFENNEWLVVHLSSGESYPIPVPELSTFVGWG